MMIELEMFKKRMQENGERLPFLTLEEFFTGNTAEDSIAPNQWGYGRPSLAEIWEVLRKTEAKATVAWVRVVLHDDTEIEECNGHETLSLCGDSIVLCTTDQPSEIEKLVNCEWLCSDGVIAIEASELAVFSCVPPVPAGYRCLEIVWD